MQKFEPPDGKDDHLLPRPPSAGDIRDQLTRIVASPEFAISERGHAFLRYVVEETLAGRAERIKAYSIAVAVFKRDERFTPDDPIVRVEAGRLRRALERYYLVTGKVDSILIDIPKGGYVPIFTRRAEPQDEPVAPASILAPDDADTVGRRPRWRISAVLMAMLGLASLAYWIAHQTVTTPVGEARMPEGPTLVVAPFADLGETADARLYAMGISEELLDVLPRFRELTVLGRETSEALSPDVDALNVNRKLGARFLLSGGVRVSGGRMRVTARLVETETGRILWTETYDNDLSSRNFFAIQADVAGKVASAVAQPGGVISHDDSLRQLRGLPDDLDAYRCTLSFYEYRAELSATKHAVVRDCLERAVGRFPAFATAWAMLSIAYVDEDRFGYNPKPALPTALERALDASRRAVQIDPSNIRGLEALMTALFFNQRLDESLRVGEQALALNRNDSEVMGEFGTRLAMSGQWRRGYDLLEQALLRNPGASGFYHANRALAAYMLHEDQQALVEIQQSDLQKFPLFHSVAAVIYAESGMTAEANREGELLLKMRPDFLSRVDAEIDKRIARPEDRARLIAGLIKAGLQPAPTSATAPAPASPLQR